MDLRPSFVSILMLFTIGVSACQQSKDLPEVESGHLRLTLAIGDDTVDGVRFSLQPVKCNDGTAKGDPIEETRSLEDIWLPGGIDKFADMPLDATSVHAFADALFTLKPGCYDVTTQPTLAGLPVKRCKPAKELSVEVVAHKTREIFLLNQCDLGGNGALDVVAAINRSPQIVDLSYERSKFLPACRLQTLCATVSDADRDPIEFVWKFTGSMLPYSGPAVVSHEMQADGSTVECIEVMGDEPGNYDFQLTVFDLVQDAGTQIRVEDWLANAGYPAESRDSLASFFYVSGAVPAVEVCENKSDDDCDGEIDEDCVNIDLPPLGTFAGSIAGIDNMRAEFDVIDPPVPNNPNLLMYEARSQDVAEPDDLQQAVVTPLNVALTEPPRVTRVPWNSWAGRQLASEFVETDYSSNWPMPDGREVCVPPNVMIDCCTYNLTEGADGSSNITTYYKPKDLFATASDANAALQQVYAQLPIFVPYTDGDVSLWQGWIYNNGDGHGSIDYGQGAGEGEDPSFRVRAAAAGTVVAKYWDSWHGNVLVVEHPGPGSFSYRTFYFHLRNGKTNDLNKALTRTTATGDPSSSRDKYLAFANLPNPSDQHWGTNSQAILVDVGDTVYAHQQIAWSGNTGPGGAGMGLNEDGTPKNANTANNHLHFMLAVSHPTWTSGEWLYVDPYGVYEQKTSNCYDLMDNTNYDRLLAPFYPYFHGVDLGVFNYYLYYYGQMGRSPATFTVQNNGSSVIAAGAFKGGLSSSWYVYDYLLANDFQDRWDTLIGADYRLIERSVTMPGGGSPRHNGVFRPDTIDDWYNYRALGWYSEWQDTFDELTQDNYDLVDFFGYHDGGSNKAAAIFVPQSGGFIHHAGLSSATFTTVTNDHAQNDGYLPVDVNVMEMAGGTYLSAIYRQTGDARMVHWGMSASEYQQWMNFYLANGWDLEVVQNYQSGARYAAIWSK